MFSFFFSISTSLRSSAGVGGGGGLSVLYTVACLSLLLSSSLVSCVISMNSVGTVNRIVRLSCFLFPGIFNTDSCSYAVYISSKTTVLLSIELQPPGAVELLVVCHSCLNLQLSPYLQVPAWNYVQGWCLRTEGDLDRTWLSNDHAASPPTAMCV